MYHSLLTRHTMYVDTGFESLKFLATRTFENRVRRRGDGTPCRPEANGQPLWRQLGGERWLYSDKLGRLPDPPQLSASPPVSPVRLCFSWGPLLRVELFVGVLYLQCGLWEG